MSLRRATGHAAYSQDLSPPGALHLALRRSRSAHARVVRVHSAPARGLPGVACLLTCEDVPRLLEPELRYHGDRLAAAAAEEPDLAWRAVESVEFDLDPLPVVLEPALALAQEERVAGRLALSHGEVEGAFRDADATVAGEWRLPFVPSVPLEPPVVTTWLDEDRRLVVRTPADAPFRLRAALAERLEVPAARIRIVRPLVAGGSGGQAAMLGEDLCGLVTLRTGRPVRLCAAFEDHVTSTTGRPAARIEIRLGLRAGRLHALDVRLLADLGAHPGSADELLRAAAREALSLYPIPNVRLEAAAVRTNHPPAETAGRADSLVAYALECAVSEAAAQAREEDGEFRLRQRRRAGDVPGTAGPLPSEGDSPDFDALVARVRREQSRGPDASRSLPASPVRSGRALTVARRGSEGGTRVGATASLRLLDDGSFALATGLATAGSADEAAYAEAAAAVLGVPASRVVCAGADTDSAPFEAGDGPASFSAIGRAVEEAARRLRERILEAAAEMLGASAPPTVIENGAVRGASGRAIDLAEIGSSALRAGRPLGATASPPPAEAPPALAAALAEAAVDEETGAVSLTRLAAAVAGGPFDDPRPAEGLVEGALALAVEQALAGGLPFDAEGRPLNPSLRSWPLVTSLDLPPLAVAFVPSGEPSSRFGAAALGEAAGRAALAAIVCAVGRAAGSPLRALPLTPGRVLGALDAARR